MIKSRLRLLADDLAQGLNATVRLKRQAYLHDIFKHYKSRPFRLGFIAQPYLSYTSVFAEEVVQIFPSDSIV